MRSSRGLGVAVGLAAAVVGLWGLPTALAAHSASSVQHALRDKLQQRGLTPRSVDCRRNGGWQCRWRATKASQGWTYHCRGGATYRPRRTGWTIDRCHLRAPHLAPLLADPVRTPAFGFNEPWVYQQDKLRMSATAGADTNRSPIAWRGVERTRGSFYWTATDNLYHQMLDNGIRPLFILGSAPCWAVAQAVRARCARDDSGGYPPAPSHYDDWGRFVARAAQRYPNVRAFEIWNEPNMDRFWLPHGPNPRQYARVLSVAYRNIKRVAPGTTVISGGLSPTPTDQHNADGIHLSYDHFLTQVYEALGSGPLPADGIGFHAYPPHNAGKDPVLRVRQLLAGIKNVLVRFRDQDLPIWVTETGVSTTGAYPYTPNGQASALVSLYDALERIPGVPTVIVHRFFDGDYGTGDWSTGLGVVAISPRVHEKPAFCALAEARGSPC